MKVVLLENVDKLGDAGTVVKVADGYARNYLLPHGYAELATTSKIEKIEKKLEIQKIEKEERLEKTKILMDKLQHTSCTITVKAGEGDKLFGAVTTQDIADTLADQGLDVDRKNIILEDNIKKLGVYNIPVKIEDE